MTPWNRLMAGAVLLCLMCGDPGAAFAHQDKHITRAPDGRLVGFPSTFAPVYLGLPDRTGSPSASIRVGSKRFEFPECLSALFRKTKATNVYLSASWYHDFKFLPPYLLIRLPDRDIADFSPYNGWNILVALDRPRVLALEVADSVGMKKVPLTTVCSEAESAAALKGTQAGPKRR